MKITRAAVLFAVLVGAMDLGTGLGLVAVPVWTLQRMGVPVPNVEALLFVRFVGAFVGAVGAVYLWAVRKSSDRLRIVFGATILLRLSAGAFVAGAVWLQAMPAAWLAVTATDWTVAGVQAWLLARGTNRHE